MIMATLTKGLPIFYVPEQLHIATMRRYMVDNRGRNQTPFLLTTNTPWIPLKKKLSCLLPFSSISTSCRASSLTRILLAVFITVFSSIRHQSRATGVLTRCLRSAWHKHHPITKKQNQNTVVLLFTCPRVTMIRNLTIQ